MVRRKKANAKSKFSISGHRVISMRLIVTAAAVILVTGAVLCVGSVAERNTRHTLTRELEARLVLEARNLALISSRALLSDYPELTLHPAVKKMKTERPELALIYVIDHNNIIQGHADAGKLGTRYALDMKLESVTSSTSLDSGETLQGNSNVLVVSTPILHPNGQIIGTAVVGLEQSRVLASLMKARRQQVIFLLAALAVSILLTSILMSRLLRPISILRAGLERIGGGDLNAQVELSSRTELSLLARSVNDMATKLKSAQRELVEKERLDHEMELAREIQQALLPSGSVKLGDFIISGAQRAAEEVGGDYYNFFPLSDGRMGLVIADVAGKGLGGCLVTSMIDVMIRTFYPSYSSPSALLVALEESLVGSIQPGMFVTMFYGILDPKSGLLTFASAGHNPALHYKSATQQVEWHKTEGIPIGLVRGGALRSSLKDHSLSLAPGDLLLESTDGFSEAADDSGEEYGFHRMEEIVKEFAEQGTQAVIGGLQKSVDEWEKQLDSSDDKTLLVISWPKPVKTDEIPAVVSEDPEQLELKLANQLWMNRTEGSLHLSIPASFESLGKIDRWLKQCIYIKELPADEIGLLEQGLYEVCANIAEHSCNLDQTKIVDIWWIPEIANDRDSLAHIHEGDSVPSDFSERISRGYFLIRDHGLPPNVEILRPPDSDRLPMRPDGRGLGLHIIHKVMRELEYHANTKVGNITIMKFRLLHHQHR